MTLMEAFRNGGWPMYPVLLSGTLLVAAAARYALRPLGEQQRLLRGLSLCTLLWGVLGTTLGLIHTLMGVAPLLPDKAYLVLIGLGESLNNLAFALILIVLATMIRVWGDLRAARDHQPRRCALRDSSGPPMPAGG